MFCQINRVFFFLITLFLLLFFSDEASAQRADILESQVTIQLPADSLIRNLHRIQEKTKCSFAYDPDLLRSKKTEAFDFIRVPLGTVLQKLLFRADLDFDLVGKDIVITPAKPKVWTVHGHVRDKSNGEELIGATVHIPKLDVGISTNQYGFYSISVPAGQYELLISHPGYESRRKAVDLNRDLQEEIELPLKEYRLAEVIISKPLYTPNPLLRNEQNFDSKQLSRAAYYSGEADVMKRLQMENGIKALTEGSSGLFVRGGNADQNLILLDEAIVYNPSHLYGLVSIFNSDAINNLQVYRDYMPANFGGRLSSVIVNRMAEGNSKEFRLHGGLSLMSVSMAAEGPIVKDKGSFILAYRRSLLDVFHNKFKLFNPNSVYYDLNAKANFKMGKNSSLFYSLYIGKDHLLSENSYTNNWGNLTSTLRWNRIISSKLFLNTSAIYSNYSNLLDLNADTLSQKSQWRTGVKDITLKTDFTYYKNPSNQIKFGLSSIFHQFIPGEMIHQQAFDFDISRDKSLEAALYYSQEIIVSKLFELNYGMRVTLFKNAQELRNIYDEDGNQIAQQEISTFFRPEPRINLNYLPKPNQRIFATFNHNYQYLQLIQNSTLAFSSLEPWVPASKRIKPQRSNHYALGYRYSPDGYMFSAGAYYKKLSNQLDLIGHAQVIRNPDIRSQLRAGDSEAYGIEVEANGSRGKFTGMLAYNYSKVFRKIKDLNFGNRYVSNYDIPHELKLTTKFDLNSRFGFQSFFTWSTGRPLTLPVGYYQHDGLNVPIFEGRNTSRFPNFSRLDISAQYQLQTRVSKMRTLSHTISIGIYNLYDRKNPLYYHLNSSSFEAKRSTVEYGFGFYPWVAYNFKI